MAKEFLIGITPDFETQAKGALDPALAAVIRPAGLKYELMPDTQGIGDAAVLDRYDAVISCAYTYPAASFQNVQRLAVLALWGVGFDHVDVQACTRSGVLIALTRDSVARPVAEGILALIFSLAKNLRRLDIQCRSGRWRENAPTLTDISGSTLGSIGLGSIAGEMFRLAGSMEFGRFIAYSPRSEAPDDSPRVELVDLDTVMRESDFVTINCPLTDETRGMIGARELSLMKPTAYLVNTARGAVVDEAALVDVLNRNRIAGAGLDVFESEPVSHDNPLLHLDNVIVTPHLVVRTAACVRDTSLSACRNVLAVAQGRTPKYIANPDVLRNRSLQQRLTEFSHRSNRSSRT